MDNNMAKKAKLPFKRRVQDAFADLFGAKSVLRVPDATNLPNTLNKRNNEEVTQFHEEHRAIAQFALATTLKQAAEAAHERTKAELIDALEIEDDLEPGFEVTHTRDNVSVLVKVNNPQRRVDREMLRTTLMVDLKLTAERADEIIKKAEKSGKPPMMLTATVND